jgi:phage FluMu protein Com
MRQRPTWVEPSTHGHDNLSEILNRILPKARCPRCKNDERLQFFFETPMIVVNGIMDRSWRKSDTSKLIGWRTDSPNFGNLSVKMIRCHKCQLEGGLEEFKDVGEDQEKE